MHLTARHGLTAIRRLTPALLVGSLFLLLVVLVAGTSANGASRWLGPGSLQFQPSELAKVALILYGADLLAREPKRVRVAAGADALPARRRHRLPADHRRARHGDDDGRSPSRSPRP